MPTDRGRAEVAALKELFSESSLIISTDYRGLDVRMMNGLRAALRASGAKYRIAKNTLVRVAIEEIDRPIVGELIDGPVGYVLWDGDPAVAAKSLVDHVRSERLELQIRGAILNGEAITSAQVEQLASLPSRDVLLARLFGQMIGPVAGLVRVLNGPLQGFATVLQRHIEIEATAEAATVEAAEEPVAEEAAEEPVAEAPDESAEATAEEPVAESAVEAAEESVAEAPEESAEAAAEEPVAEAPEESTEATAEEPLAEAAVEAAEVESTEATAESADESAEDAAAEESAEESADESVNEPAEESKES